MVRMVLEPATYCSMLVGCKHACMSDALPTEPLRQLLNVTYQYTSISI